MSVVSEHAAISLMIADYAQVAPESGKLNVLGGEVTIVGFDPLQGLTARFSVVMSVAVPAEFLPEDCSVELALYQGGSAVVVPGPVENQAVRVGQSITLDRNASPHLPQVLRNHLNGATIVVVDFSNGLPLRPGEAYEWVARIDGDMDRAVVLPFAVPGLPASPVIG